MNWMLFVVILSGSPSDKVINSTTVPMATEQLCNAAKDQTDRRLSRIENTVLFDSNPMPANPLRASSNSFILSEQFDRLVDERTFDGRPQFALQLHLLYLR
jgi:hypothetical protein